MHIGLTELVVIVLLIMAFFSPDQLKVFASKLGSSIKVFRESVDTLSEPVNEVKQTVDDVKREVMDTVTSYGSNEQQNTDKKEE